MPQPDRLDVMNLPEPGETPEDIAKYLNICDEKIGFVPNVLKSYARMPEKFRVFSRMYNELMMGESGLSPLEREMIAVVVSSANHCYYCLVAHGQAVRAMADDPELGEMMVLNYRVADLPARQMKMLDFAWKITKDPHGISEEDRQGLRDEGWTDRDILDIADVAAFFNYTNRVAHATEMMPNKEYHGLNR